MKFYNKFSNIFLLDWKAVQNLFWTINATFISEEIHVILNNIFETVNMRLRTVLVKT